MAFEKCAKCGYMHYATDKCPAPMLMTYKKITRAEAEVIFPPVPAKDKKAMADALSEAKVTGSGWTKTSSDGVEHIAAPARKDRHKPGYYAEYMRTYRAKKKAAK